MEGKKGVTTARIGRGAHICTIAYFVSFRILCMTPFNTVFHVAQNIKLLCTQKESVVPVFVFLLANTVLLLHYTQWNHAYWGRKRMLTLGFLLFPVKSL